MVDGGMKCVKYVLFLFNLIFFICGLALIIVGAVTLTQVNNYITFLGGSATGLAILVIVIGCIIFTIGFFGCCGAYKENYCMVMTFAFLLGIIFVLEIAAGIGAYVARDQVGDLITDEMEDSMSSYSTPGDETIRDAWDLVQHDLQCCGTNGSDSWTDRGVAIPESCCKTEQSGCTAVEANMYPDGCLDKFIKWVVANIIIIGGVGIGLSFVQIVGIFLSCCLARSIKKEYQVV